MADIFISYAEEDIEHARALVHLLAGQDWSVFWDRKLLPGPRFREVLAQELDQARCVMVLWSRQSISNDWVADEAEEGKKGDRLVSVLIDNVMPPLGFRQSQAARLWDWDRETETTETTKLLKGIAAVIGLREEEPPPPPPSPVVQPVPPAPPRFPATAATFPDSFLSRHPAMIPTLFLILVFAANYLQTAMNDLTTLEHLGPAGGYPFAEAFNWFEAELKFESHDVSSPISYKGYSISYFFLFPIIALLVVLALALDQNPRPYRTLSLAVVINYLLSVPFYLFMPVPERWAYPDSEAILLSDLWNESLITLIRPISGLDNCFPSSHTSLTVILIAVCYLYSVRLRTSLLFIGASIIFATFVLGIHWIPDILAGIFVGLLSVILAKRLVDSGKSDFLWG